MLTLIEYALMIALVAYVYCCLLVLPGQILYPWYVWLYRQAEKFGEPTSVWWFKILVGCERCFAGQVACWSFAAVCSCWILFIGSVLHAAFFHCGSHILHALDQNPDGEAMSERVVCIKDDGYDPVHTLWIREFPVKGQVYTIRKRVHSAWDMGLLLEEIVNPTMPNGAEPNFARHRFRPATEEDLQTQITAYVTEEN